ncbi:hypothetical protein [uncultured Lutibacter sp.]|uniref:hypothetical protein n=1 Tax=uncultured Lutibacter sp. TaxID=437739 RepID=UPI00262D6056|nr:hypothetical protein [uncultured Lutibacter sp.]
MSVSIKNQPLPESPELNGGISVDEIQECIKKTIPSLSQSEVVDLSFNISAIIGFKDSTWNLWFQKRLENLYSGRPLHLKD